MLQHSHHHIAVINRHFLTWAWGRHQRHRPGHPVRHMVTLVSRILFLRTARMFHSVVDEGVAKLGVVISDVILLLYPRPKKLLSWRSKRGLRPASNSQYQGLPGLPGLPGRLQRVPPALIGLTAQRKLMRKVVNPSSQCQIQLV